MKILMINRYSFPEVMGGAHKYYYDLAKNLAKKGHEVHLVYSVNDPQAVLEEKVEGVYKHKFLEKGKGALEKNYHNIKQTFEISKRILDEHGVDIVNFHDGRLPLKLFLSEEFSQIPFIYNCQADSAFEYEWDYKKEMENKLPFLKKMKMHIKFPFHYYWHRYCLSKAIERTNGIIVLSDYVAQTIKNNYGEKYSNKIKKIPSGVFTELFYPVKGINEKKELRDKLNLPKDKIIFLTIRRMTLRMGWFNLIDAVKMLFEKAPQYKDSIAFVFVGGGDLLEQLKKYVDDLRLSGNIIFTGKVPDGYPQLYNRASDCFIIPTEELEGFGIVSIEAFASGIPVIGTPKGSVPEVLSEIDADFITENHLPDGICKAIEKMLNKIKNNEINSNKLRNIAVEKFSWDVVTNNIEKYFYNIIQNNIRKKDVNKDTKS